MNYRCYIKNIYISCTEDFRKLNEMIHLILGVLFCINRGNWVTSGCKWTWYVGTKPQYIDWHLWFNHVQKIQNCHYTSRKYMHRNAGPPHWKLIQI